MAPGGSHRGGAECAPDRLTRHVTTGRCSNACSVKGLRLAPLPPLRHRVFNAAGVGAGRARPAFVLRRDMRGGASEQAQPLRHEAARRELTRGECAEERHRSEVASPALACRAAPCAPSSTCPCTTCCYTRNPRFNGPPRRLARSSLRTGQAGARRPLAGGSAVPSRS